MRSMTGFGRYRHVAEGRTVEVETKTVNHRFLKLSIRLPRDLAAFESDVEAGVRAKMRRGAVSLNIRVTEDEASSGHQLNQDTARRLYLSAKELAESLELPPPTLAAIMNLPGVVGTPDAEAADDSVRETIKTAVSSALDELIAMREREGATLQAELRSIAANIATHVEAVAERAPVVVTTWADKLEKRINQLLTERSSGQVTKEDLAREIALHADRADISEEIQRLRSHLEQFEDVISAEEVGRKLEFLLQEMLREANTIASKSGDTEIGRRVIEIKTDLERLREQAQNVE